MINALNGVPVIINHLFVKKTVWVVGKGTPNLRIEVDSMDTLRELVTLMNERQVANG